MTGAMPAKHHSPNAAPSRRAPPYARRTAHHPRPDGRVIVGSAGWDIAKLIEKAGGFRYRFAVLPPDSSPDALDWSCFADCEVLLSYYGRSHQAAAAAAAVAIVMAGARMVLAVDHTAETPMDVYRPRAAGGAHG